MKLQPLRQLFRSRTKEVRPRVPKGARAYVIGDIHGRLDLFDELIHAIETDDQIQTPADTTIILLGDLVDRGPESAGVLARARDWQSRRRVRILAGNHEEMFLRSFEDEDVLRHFLKHGGRETLLSYGIRSRDLKWMTLEELFEKLPHLVPERDRQFMKSFEELVTIGDYVFVHAGVDPERPLDEQKRHDLLWIREPFLRHDEPFPAMIIHGHTIYEEIDERPNRIGIDTGAFRHGRLTALVLEGETRRYMQAVDRDGEISIEERTDSP